MASESVPILIVRGRRRDRVPVGAGGGGVGGTDPGAVMITKSTLNRFHEVQKRLAKERDLLRELEQDIQAQLDSVDRASDALVDCIDALSEFV